ncbi:MAG: master DNA invertase Mpi family serine-type recombinase [Lentisphaerae bacterium]|nr:master DNA invertase Mpi family serine-type recombinase [Lentisphaerota bacterium]OQC13848.1 MAG: putative DNA-invertase from lambdoid prophage Rac [Lentisphaerae bacterium ADurb.Bin082]
MIYGYIRVSTDKQNTENQRFEITRFCGHQDLKIDSWMEETISGTVEINQRRLGKLLKKLKKDDMIICTEISRLGRTLFMIMDVLNLCHKKGVHVWTVKDNFRLGTDLTSKILAFALGISAEIERELISQRTREALARKKAEGVRLGRPIGSKNRRRKLDGKESEILQMYEQGYSKAAIARRVKVSRQTVANFLASVRIDP